MAPTLNPSRDVWTCLEYFTKELGYVLTIQKHWSKRLDARLDTGRKVYGVLGHSSLELTLKALIEQVFQDIDANL